MRALAVLPILLSALAACGPGAAVEAERKHSSLLLRDGVRLSSPRATHAIASLADGRLLVIGGCVAAGCEAGPTSATIDIVASDGSALVGRGKLLLPRVQPSAVALPDGTVLIVGGWVDGAVSARTEIFDPALLKSRWGPELPQGLGLPTLAALSDGRILIAGGTNGQQVVADAHVYDHGTGRLTPVGPLITARAGASGTRLNDGRILIVGGGDSESRNRHALASAELFDPATGHFTRTASLGQRRYKHGAVALPSGDVLIIGGSDERDYGGKLRTVERYHARTGTFRVVGQLAVPRFKLADAVVPVGPNQVLIAGGDEQPELFDAATGSSRLLPARLGGQWNYLTAARAANGAIFLAGGYREGTIEPTDRTWLLYLGKS